MLLSIDRVLQLLAEGKSIEKISELADCGTADVVSLIEEARELIHRHEKASGRRKLIIKNKKSADQKGPVSADDEVSHEVMSGTELAAIPVSASLTMYIHGMSDPESGNAGIGIVIFDHENRQVGKVSDFVGRRSEAAAEYVALIRALKLAEYFRVSELKIRTDSGRMVRQFSGGQEIKNATLRGLADQASVITDRIGHFRLELIPRSQNDKADFLARKGSEKSR
ncbi:MAG TPA: reverse transcriptase-like protein [Spirochaetota bacterium]|nr:reverse transcriptase-like protein [Spirochaetota bacterium]HQO39049.1 reverse transcriptase-like protein [Spirochaetota bacterium]